MAKSTSERFSVDDLIAVSGLKEVSAMARGAGFNMAVGLGNARSVQLTRDRDRALRRGDAARAAELGALIDWQGRLNIALISEAERETVVPMPVNAEQAAYRGRVTNGGRGQPRFTVELVDASGDCIAEDETGPRGAFTLAHAPSESAPAIRVSDEKGRVLLLKGALKPLAAGRSAYIEVPIDGLAPQTPPKKPPKGGAPANVIVPSVVGLPLTDARRVLKDVALAARKAGEVLVPGEAGCIVRQDPAAGNAIEVGGIVALIVGAPEDKGFPDLSGKTLKAADAAVRELNLRRDTVVLVPDKKNAGNVVGQSPKADGIFTPETRVLLRVATGDGKADIATVIACFGSDPRMEALKVSEATLRNRLKAAEVAGIEDLRKVVSAGADVFAKRMGIKDKRTARLVQVTLGEIARKFPEGS